MAGTIVGRMLVSLFVAGAVVGEGLNISVGVTFYNIKNAISNLQKQPHLRSGLRTNTFMVRLLSDPA